MSKEEISVPYITDSGLPIHVVSEAEQKGYMAAFTVEQRHEVISHANALFMRIRGKAQERADLKKQSRELLRIRADATPEVRAARMEELAALKATFDKLAEEIEKMKATEYKLKDGELVIPPLRLK